MVKLFYTGVVLFYAGLLLVCSGCGLSNGSDVYGPVYDEQKSDLYSRQVEQQDTEMPLPERGELGELKAQADYFTAKGGEQGRVYGDGVGQREGTLDTPQ